MTPRLIKVWLSASVISIAVILTAQAQPSITVDVGTGKVLSHEDAFKRWYPASLTKLMTAYVAFRKLQSGQIRLDTPVRITANAAKEPPSKMGYKPGSMLTLDDALKIIMVKSANDVSMALGETLGGGSAKNFVKMMNDEAQRLGMFDTHFSNPHGLHDVQNYSTARDLAILSVQLRREFPQFAHYFKTEAIDTGDGKKPYRNTNSLLGRYKGTDGMKTGFVCASGFNLVSSATRNGRSILSVVLGEFSDETRAIKTAQLLEDGFRNNGANSPTLASLQRYGENNETPTNMRAQICNQEAVASRVGERYPDGQLKIASPYIQPPAREPIAVPVRLISQPSPVKPGQLHISQIPIPSIRPQ